MCRDCGYDEYDKGNWRQQVTACTAVNCPLHPVRPLTKGKTVYLERTANSVPESALDGGLR